MAAEKCCGADPELERTEKPAKGATVTHKTYRCKKCKKPQVVGEISYAVWPYFGAIPLEDDGA
jgi:hypothetical protein